MAKTILVADDSVTIRKVVEWTFHETDIRVELVASGREALERLTTLRPDLVLVDVVMPEPTGYEICRAVKDSDHPVPVLLLAGTFEPFDPARAKSCGADGHVVKPFESRALLRRVEDLLADPGVVARLERDPALLRTELDAVLDEIARDPAFEAQPDLGLAGADLVETLLGPERALAPEPPPEREAARDDRGTDPHVARIDARSDRSIDDTPIDVSASSRHELSDDDIARIARVVLATLSDRIVREIAWEVVPDLAEAIIRERIRHLERVDEGPA